MPTSDFSRWSTDFRKRYSDVRMQQGRVVTDDDVNEAGRLRLEDQRRTRIDVIGPSGSPDAGFQVSNPVVTADGPDFDIEAGTLYLGGLRLHLDEPTTYRGQSDFLQLPVLPPPAGAARVDFVYIEAWQQHVSAVEDSELFEVALAGPDTSTRLRTMQRIHVAAEVEGEDCRQALDAVLAGMEGTLNSELELEVDARLTVTFDPNSNPANLCSPAVQGGYLGAENQAIRVELIDATHFTWGFDNASPLYRVEVDVNAAGQRGIIRLITAPKDQAHWPLAGQTIELLPWSAILPNGEKVAETSGFLAKADGSFNPDTSEVSIDTPVPANFGLGWQAHALEPQLADSPQYFYMRIWNRGSDTASAASITFVPNGAAVPLGDTGLRVEFTGTQFRTADHWVIAARPEARNTVVPWALQISRRPHGYQRYFAPLALIRWTPAGNGFAGVVIDDCRDPFPPLTRIRSCCTYTVGDGVSSHGNFQSIQAAVDALPPAGGEICVLPGRHVGRIRITRRTRIRIHGCGYRSLIVPGQERGGGPLVLITSSTHIKLDGLRLESGTEQTIVVRQTVRRGASSFLTFEKLDIESAWSALDVDANVEVRILSNNISLVGAETRENIPQSAMAAVMVRADDVLIEGNTIRSAERVGRLRAALGGIHLRGGCERVEIRRNLIQGGNGNGITLGSFFTERREEEDDEPTIGILFPGFILVFDDDGCPSIIVIPPDRPDPENPPLVPRPEGFLYDILIHDNRIENMGMSGIAGAWALIFRGETFLPRPSTVERLTITNNRIRRCLALGMGNFPISFEDRVAFGGIALQQVLDLAIRENVIRDNGALQPGPACGIFAVAAAGVLIHENQIAGNGSARGQNQFATFGTRGGIILPHVLDNAMMSDDAAPQGEYALRVHDNTVAVPLGPALRAGAYGAVSVTDNHLSSAGFVRRRGTLERLGVAVSDVAGNNAYVGHQPYLTDQERKTQVLEFLTSAVVVLLNQGVATELAGLPMNVTNSISANRAAAAVANPVVSSNGGTVLFNDNQVLALESGDAFPPRMCVIIFSSDDISVQDNQSDYQSVRPFFVNALLFGLTVRVNGNRFQEPFPVTTISAVTGGIQNITSLNEATHCIVTLPFGFVIDVNNIPPACRDVAGLVMQRLVALLG